MTKYNDPTASLRQSFRQYNRSNREDWADLGFRHMTCFVHDDERDMMLAELEVRKCAALVAMAENSKTPANTLLLLSRRNMSALPQTGDLTALSKQAEDSTAAAQIEVMVDIAKNFIKRFRGIEAAYEKATDEEKRVRMAARAVAYSAAAAAQVRLLKATLAFEPKRERSIFGMVGEFKE